LEEPDFLADLPDLTLPEPDVLHDTQPILPVSEAAPSSAQLVPASETQHDTPETDDLRFAPPASLRHDSEEFPALVLPTETRVEPAIPAPDIPQPGDTAPAPPVAEPSKAEETTGVTPLVEPDLSKLDTGSMSIWDIFGVPRPSETQQMRAVAAEAEAQTEPAAIAPAAPEVDAPAELVPMGEDEAVLVDAPPAPLPEAPLAAAIPEDIAPAVTPVSLHPPVGLRIRLRRKSFRLRRHI
jgi:hypothetical protein